MTKLKLLGNIFTRFIIGALILVGISLTIIFIITYSIFKFALFGISLIIFSLFCYVTGDIILFLTKKGDKGKI